jgi:hypothetical protein
VEELKEALNKMYQSGRESENKTAGYSFIAIGMGLIVAGRSLNDLSTALFGVLEFLIGCVIVIFLASWEAKRKSLFD